MKVNQELAEQARQAGQHATCEEAVHSALQEYVQRRRVLRILDLFGQVDYDPNYDYKAERARDGS